ncbi:type II and III secretion system protein family protein [Parasphingopyxis algicola]|uniref:type II and III secretion system protein family protein n=1 Tax=Parasphingopyxis algicola TaxID=2026624 RepID=UPI001FEB12C3|nr:type II and III secretion system protein family protein [Parasphingopyxis algicola]QLC24505.1 type II and III secretion system protein family protein [Parasphingopyxis algicola]
MTFTRTTRFGAMAAVAATALVASLGAPVSDPAHAQSVARAAPVNTLTLSVGRGELVNLPRSMTDLFVADDAIADVQVRSSRALYVFGKAAGETTVYATDAAGNVVYSATVRVGTNLNSVSSMLDLAMPEAAIAVTPMNGLVLLTGTVASPSDVQEAQSLVQAFVGEETQVVSRLRTATPLQVNLQVRIAEVSRSVVRDIGANLLTRDTTGGFQFGIGRGNPGTIGNADLSGFPQVDASALYGLPAGSVNLPFNPATGQFITSPVTENVFNFPADGGTTLGAAGRLFGLDILGTLDLAETEGLVTTLAEPNLTALSGETASFLAGGEFPIPLSQGLGSVSIEYKQFGVSLAFTPVVLDNGRISMRVRPEVSELSDNGAITLNGFTVPALTTRRAETTVELGSGQSFMIAGLLQNSHNSTVDRTPGLGDVPILGTLFRSNRWRRAETELVIVVTPYLVQPVSANQIALPTDGYRSPSDLERVFLGRTFGGETGATRPGPTMAPPTTVQPGMDTGAANRVPSSPAAPQTQQAAQAASQSGAAPGFSFNE